MKTIRRIILVIAMMAALPAAAQDLQQVMDEYSKVKHAHDSLAQRVSELEKQLKDDTTRLKKQWKNDTTRLKKQWEKDTLRISKTVENLKKELKKADNKAIEQLNEEKASLIQQNEFLANEIKALNEKFVKAEATIAQQEKDLKELLPIREQLLRQTLENSREWALLPFSQLDEQLLSKTMEGCQRYGGNDKEFKEAAQSLEQLLTELRQYLHARDLLEKPFNEQNKDASRLELKTLMEKYQDKPQAQEIDSVDVLLRDYDGSVYCFQDFIAAVDKELDSWREAKNKVLAKSTLDQMLEEDGNKETMQCINAVPYLKRRLDEYLTALRQKPLEHWSGEQEIKDMVK